MVSATAATVMTHVMTATLIMTHVMTTLVLPTAVVFTVVFDVVSLVVMAVPMPIVPSIAAAPPEAGHPRAITAYVPAGSLPAGVVPTIVTTIPDVLRSLDQFQTVGRSANPISGADWCRLCATIYKRTTGHQHGGEYY
jgi:riboflavin transporter FmnP